ncbi:hypothetical protein K466DRAFT_586402 [Polyporus arcularius HHB13444]|uniref:F-box domain-containing protein n=1 Tax=Polyporus arcularius HHB13444 TaxID=1314778 RepID=A0A5C3PGW1_9APHY|nr:hypothetical protein K466DRAFT_586402 [Polyporus arcularius HHB13444]
MSLRLPFDVLVVIQSVADQATIGRMLQCCRYLKATGEWFILRDVRLTSSNVLEGFVGYMLSNHVSRLPLLHGLRLEMTPPPTVPRDSLRELFIKLRTGSKLVRLSIHHPEELLQRHAGLSSAIAALTSLQHLELWNAGPTTVGMLHAVRSKLVGVNLHMGSGGPHGLPDVIQLLRGSQNTLEEMTVTRPGPTTSHPLGESNATTFTLCYPRMHTLTLIEPTYSLYTADYIRAFPNLRSLAILDPHEYPLRDPNRPPSNTDPYKTWPSLRYVEGSIKMLYGLALPCHVPTIDIHDFDYVPQVDLLRVVVADTRPVHLKLSVLSEQPQFARCNRKDGHPSAVASGEPGCIRHRRAPTCTRSWAPESPIVDDIRGTYHAWRPAGQYGDGGKIRTGRDTRRVRCERLVPASCGLY